MKNILICPDSFKGSISAERFCEIASEELCRHIPDCNTTMLPIADGGEGTLDSLYFSLGGRLVTVETENPYREPIEAELLITEDGTAVIESARSAGLPLVKGRANPELTSTYGIGLMIREAVKLGAREIILTLGGSSTNDCGLGMLSAMGYAFYNEQGEKFVPTGGTLHKVARIEREEQLEQFSGVKFTAMCDVVNPLCGPMGCAEIYSRQKGADEDMVARLEAGARSFARVAALFLGRDHSEDQGAGAAGGLGFACSAFLSAELKSGIDTVLDLTDFESKLSDCDLIITGEGSFDEQSMMGKVIGGIVKRCGDVPVAVLCGRYQPFDGDSYPTLRHIIPISEGQELSYAMTHAEENLRAAVEKLSKRI